MTPRHSDTEVLVTMLPVMLTEPVPPLCTPDGATLYYVIELPVVTGGSDLEFRAATPEDGPSRLLARIPVGRTAPWQVFQPVISPDGRWLAFALLD